MKQLLLLSCVLLFCKHTECVRQILSGIIECVVDRLVFFIDRMRSRIGRISPAGAAAYDRSRRCSITAVRGW